MNTENTEISEVEAKEQTEVVVPNLFSLAQLVNLARPYPTKGQQPRIDRRNSGVGHLTGRVHICFGCGSLATQVGEKWDRTLRRLFVDGTPVDQQTKRQRRSHSKPRTGRQYTLYTHHSCREVAYQKAQQFIQAQLQEALNARSEEGIVA